ncbi:hypothetical protein [Pedobacter gandavensis]|uniref:hypothetical protein n=1 Tax=Pedobacter gandavensis TaxID=2679963 RepID=UPI00292CB434|nr:hypothetical protein [Pedobacter gandavensis]
MHFNLSTEIIKRSVSKYWDIAKLEWNFEYLYVSDEFQTCLCGHYPIKNVCVIRNHRNNTETEVGNCCVNKFLGIDRGNKILDSIKRLKIDLSKSMSAEVLEYLKEKHVISEWDYDFYIDTLRKRIMSYKQLEHRERINQKLIDFSSGEVGSALGKIHTVLKWADDNKDFDITFIHSLKKNCERAGKLSEGQNRALDNIITKFKIN